MLARLDKSDSSFGQLAWPAYKGVHRCLVARSHYRFAYFVMPFSTLFPNGPLTDNIIAQPWIPMDDTRTMAFTFSWKHKTPVLGLTRTGEPLPLLDRISPTLPNTANWFDRWRMAANPDIDYLIDREAERHISYTGIGGVFPRGEAVTESMGEISDRTLEHLAPSDRMIVMTGRRLIDAARALRDTGAIPPLGDDPNVSGNARSGDLIAREDQPWPDAYAQTLGRALHPEVPRAAE